MSDEVRIEIDHLTDLTADPLVLTDSGWISYEITSDMMSGADSFTLQLDPNRELVDWFRYAGHTMRVYVGGHLQMTGMVESAPLAAGEGGLSLTITGRDFGGLLGDDAAPMITYANLTLKQIAEALIEPHAQYITEVLTDNAANRYKVCGRPKNLASLKNQTDSEDGRRALANAKARAAKGTGKKSKYYAAITTERTLATRTKAGEKIWDRLESLAKQIGCIVWMTADGKLVIGRPDYSQAPIYDPLYVRVDDDMNTTDSNCVIEHSGDIGDRYGSWVATGQGQPAASSLGIDLTNKYTRATDPHPAFWISDGGALQQRVHSVYTQTVSNVESAKQNRRVARTMMEERIVKSAKLVITTEGHRQNDATPIWGIDTICDVEFGPRKIKAPYYIWRRVLRYQRGGERTTEIEAIPSGIWLQWDHDTLDDQSYLSSLAFDLKKYAGA